MIPASFQRRLGLSLAVRRVRQAWTAVWLACVLAATTVSAEDISPRAPFFARLVTPMTSIQDGKPLREALESIADQVELNLWLDRRVDPTTPVAAGPVGPTIAAAIERVAAERDCVMMPVAGIVLVGRPAWVDATTATLLSLVAAGGNRQSVANISWDALSTPQTAIAVAAGSTSAESSPPLPHDLWPAVDWRRIDRRVAVSLVLAQFDLRPQSPLSLASLRCEPATSEGTFTRRYTAGNASSSIRQAIARVDPQAAVRIRGDLLEANTTASAHRAATMAMLAAELKDLKRDPNGAPPTFSLKPTRATAADLFRSFARTAGRKCVIDPAAAEACESMVAIEAEQQTLRQLTDKVAQQAGVAANWQPGAIVITLAD